MNKQRRMMVKIIIIIFCFILLWWLLFQERGKPQPLPQPAGAGTRVQDVVILSQALKAEFSDSEIYRKLTERCKTDAEALLSYEEYREILAVIGTGQTPLFDTLYRLEHLFRQADWERAFSEMRRFHDPAGKIGEVTVTILGIGENVRDSQGEALSLQQLLTAQDGLFSFASDEFRKYGYQTVDALCMDGELLTVTGVPEKECKLENVFLLSGGPELLYFYQDYEIQTEPAAARVTGRDVPEQVADLYFADGRLTDIVLKNNKINGKLLAVTAKEVTIEGHGTFALNPGLQVYRLYDTLKTGHLRDAAVGYDFTDFIVEDGQICAALLARKAAMEYIRVAIGTEDFAGLVHERLTFGADVDYTVTYRRYDDRQSQVFPAGEELILTPDSKYLKEGSVLLTPTVQTGRMALLSLKRNQGTPEYRGSMEISKTKEGLLAVNEVLLEEYLYSVVPSEMPASYPLEALKAQAICARTYAYRYLLHAGLGDIGAHVDDSVGYQVYNNIAEQSNTTKAVKETTGKMLYYADAPAETYYYSTSCGYGTTSDIWKSAAAGDTSYLQAAVHGRPDGAAPPEMTAEESFAAFIGQVREGDYEAAEPWYRWQVEIKALNAEKIEENLKKRYAGNEKLILTLEKGEFVSRPVKRAGDIRDIYCEKRLPGGVMDELIIVTTGNTFKVISENAIREVLNDGTAVAVRQDGSEIKMPGLLPSAFMIIETVKEKGLVTGLRLTGGGYGHGVGMSQNGAKALGERGLKDEAILARFYAAGEVRQVYSHGAEP